MTWRDWVLAVGAGLCVGLVPACSHTLNQTAGASPLPPPTFPGKAAVEETPPTFDPGPPAPPSPPESAGKAVQPGGAPLEPIQLASGPDRHSEPDPPPVRDPKSVPQQIAAAEAARAPLPTPEVKARPVPDVPLVAALRSITDKQLTDRQLTEALTCLKHYDPRAQELLLCLLPLVARVSEADFQRVDKQEVAAILDELDRLAAMLRPLAQLTISKMCFCSYIKNYGEYQPLQDEHGFEPGERVNLYVELENFATERRGSRFFISLATQMDILDEYGKVAWPYRLNDSNDPDVSRTPHRDFFITYRFSIPRDIPPGRYILKLRVKDMATQRITEHTLDFRVVPARGSSE